MREALILLAYCMAVWAAILWGVYEIARPVFWPILTSLEAQQ